VTPADEQDGTGGLPGQELDQRKLGEILKKDCQAQKLNREDAMDRNRWRKHIGVSGYMG